MHSATTCLGAVFGKIVLPKDIKTNGISGEPSQGKKENRFLFRMEGEDVDKLLVVDLNVQILAMPLLAG